MVAMSILFGLIVTLMVLLGVLTSRRRPAPFTDLGAQELQEYTRPFGPEETLAYGTRDGRPSKVIRTGFTALHPG